MATAGESSQASDIGDPFLSLRHHEKWWAEHQPWLLENGFRLRPRYQPDWVPSFANDRLRDIFYEDGVQPLGFDVLDATQVSDGKLVMLKKVKRGEFMHEMELNKFVASEPQASDKQNHCLAMIRSLEVPDSDLDLMVMPYVHSCHKPDFETFGEVVDFLRQAFEGIQYLHKNLIAHRDCTYNNFMMEVPESMFPDGFHPADVSMTRDYKRKSRHRTRTECPPRYLVIDLGFGVRFSPDEKAPRAGMHIGADDTAPERKEEFIDPFALDIYYLGNIMQLLFTKGDPYGTGMYGKAINAKRGFGFLQPLIRDMVQHDPTKRPKIDEVVARFDTIVKGLSQWKLRCRVSDKWEFPIFGLWRTVRHWTRNARWMRKGLPSIPLRAAPSDSVPHPEPA